MSRRLNVCKAGSQGIKEPRLPWKARCSKLRNGRMTCRTKEIPISILLLSFRARWNHEQPLCKMT